MKMVIHERSESPPISPTPEKSCKGLSLLFIFLLSLFSDLNFMTRLIDLQSVSRLTSKVANEISYFENFFPLHDMSHELSIT